MTSLTQRSDISNIWYLSIASSSSQVNFLSLSLHSTMLNSENIFSSSKSTKQDSSSSSEGCKEWIDFI